MIQCYAVVETGYPPTPCGGGGPRVGALPEAPTPTAVPACSNFNETPDTDDDDDDDTAQTQYYPAGLNLTGFEYSIFKIALIDIPLRI